MKALKGLQLPFFQATINPAVIRCFATVVRSLKVAKLFQPLLLCA